MITLHTSQKLFKNWSNKNIYIYLLLSALATLCPTLFHITSASKQQLTFELYAATKRKEEERAKANETIPRATRMADTKTNTNAKRTKVQNVVFSEFIFIKHFRLHFAIHANLVETKQDKETIKHSPYLIIF